MLSEIVNRRSIRAYLPRLVSRADIETVLRAGALAPSSKNRQPWRFTVTLGAKKEESLAAMARGLEEEARRPLLPESARHLGGAIQTLAVMKQAPALIFVTNPMGRDPRQALNADERISELCNAQSLGACLENMALQATALGLGSLWICDIYFAYDALREWIGGQGALAAAMALGYASEAPPPRPRKPLEQLVEWRE
jgi:nitroreductase